MSTLEPPSFSELCANHYYKCWFVLLYDGREVFQQIFNWGFPKHSNLIKKKLFDAENYSNGKYRSEFNASQRQKIEEGDVNKFDLCLFYLLLQRICSLPSPSDKEWGKQGDPHSLPNILYQIKIKRNNFAHTNIEISEREMLDEIQELKSLFGKVLDLAANWYKVETCVLSMTKEKINLHIQSVQDSNLDGMHKNMKIVQKEDQFGLNESEVDLIKEYQSYFSFILTQVKVYKKVQVVKEGTVDFVEKALPFIQEKVIHARKLFDI